LGGKRFEVNCLSKIKIWVHIHRLAPLFLGKFSLIYKKKRDPTFSLPFLFIKYSKTAYQKHHIHVNIQNLKKMGHIFKRKKIMGL
jgi:hypothetical protein